MLIIIFLKNLMMSLIETIVQLVVLDIDMVVYQVLHLNNLLFDHDDNLELKISVVVVVVEMVNLKKMMMKKKMMMMMN
eukprot:CAMPEP_0174825502 /NCGR_PEP_ID=MMETSP1107-20130205/42822_1 /TAXON_ID=36770 /ORGANISM="Paraphysomonas vestita, Strain GFlagA" /LENGTH=77 /DNA_ID=CAMNT_0016057179 /DNA_START=1057 /DNA_END=1290 /DNA_ORIENTATION=+